MHPLHAQICRVQFLSLLLFGSVWQSHHSTVQSPFSSLQMLLVIVHVCCNMVFREAIGEKLMVLNSERVGEPRNTWGN